MASVTDKAFTANFLRNPLSRSVLPNFPQHVVKLPDEKTLFVLPFLADFAFAITLEQNNLYVYFNTTYPGQKQKRYHLNSNLEIRKGLRTNPETLKGINGIFMTESLEVNTEQFPSSVTVRFKGDNGRKISEEVQISIAQDTDQPRKASDETKLTFCMIVSGSNVQVKKFTVAEGKEKEGGLRDEGIFSLPALVAQVNGFTRAPGLSSRIFPSRIPALHPTGRIHSRSGRR